MPTITVTISNSNVVTVKPPVAVAKPTDLTATWNVINNGTLDLANPPITFPWPVPSGATPPPLCSAFTQYTGAVVPGSGANQWQTTFTAQPSGVTQCYKYNVAYANGGFYDPEVENQGVPPQPGTPDFVMPGRPEDTPGRGPR